MPVKLVQKNKEGSMYLYLEFDLDNPKQKLGADMEFIDLQLCDKNGQGYRYIDSKIEKYECDEYGPSSYRTAVISTYDTYGRFGIFQDISDETCAVTQTLLNLPLKTELLVSGPIGLRKYLGFGNFFEYFFVL